MEHYIVSAIKYRTSKFVSVFGQIYLTSNLRNAIAFLSLAHC